MKYFPFHTFVMDTETTGLDPEKHQMLSLGGVLLNEELEQVDEIEVFVRHEEYVVQPEAMMVNKIDLVEHHKNASVPPCWALDQLTSFFARHSGMVVLAGWGAMFDYQFLYHTVRKYDPSWKMPFVTKRDGGPTGARAIDICSIAMAYTGSIQPASAPHPHTALGDARAEADQFREIMQAIRP